MWSKKALLLLCVVLSALAVHPEQENQTVRQVGAGPFMPTPYVFAPSPLLLLPSMMPMKYCMIRRDVHRQQRRPVPYLIPASQVDANGVPATPRRLPVNTVQTERVESDAVHAQSNKSSVCSKSKLDNTVSVIVDVRKKAESHAVQCTGGPCDDNVDFKISKHLAFGCDLPLMSDVNSSQDELMLSGHYETGVAFWVVIRGANNMHELYCNALEGLKRYLANPGDPTALGDLRALVGDAMNILGYDGEGPCWQQGSQAVLARKNSMYGVRLTWLSGAIERKQSYDIGVIGAQLEEWLLASTCSQEVISLRVGPQAVQDMHAVLSQLAEQKKPNIIVNFIRLTASVPHVVAPCVAKVLRGDQMTFSMENGAPQRYDFCDEDTLIFGCAANGGAFWVVIRQAIGALDDYDQMVCHLRRAKGKRHCGQYTRTLFRYIERALPFNPAGVRLEDIILQMVIWDCKRNSGNFLRIGWCDASRGQRYYDIDPWNPTASWIICCPGRETMVSIVPREKHLSISMPNRVHAFLKNENPQPLPHHMAACWLTDQS